MNNKLILCLDFDGTIHSYVSGWNGEGAHVILDDPVPGAFEFIRDALNHFDVQIFSARSGLPGGIDAMKAWFLRHGWEEAAHGQPVGITFPTSKPPAHISLDDRAMTFTGTWPDLEQLKGFRPWNGVGI